jgi:hypothetical protein
MKWPNESEVLVHLHRPQALTSFVFLYPGIRAAMHERHTALFGYQCIGFPYDMQSWKSNWEVGLEGRLL